MYTVRKHSVSSLQTFSLRFSVGRAAAFPSFFHIMRRLKSYMGIFLSSKANFILPAANLLLHLIFQWCRMCTAENTVFSDTVQRHKF